jgi:hypothetical protein
MFHLRIQLGTGSGAKVMPAAFGTQSASWIKIAVSAGIALDFPGKGSIAVHVDALLGRRPAWLRARQACGGASIATGAMRHPEEDCNGQSANQQASKECGEGRYARASQLDPKPKIQGRAWPTSVGSFGLAAT